VTPPQPLALFPRAGGREGGEHGTVSTITSVSVVMFQRIKKWGKRVLRIIKSWLGLGAEARNEEERLQKAQDTLHIIFHDDRNIVARAIMAKDNLQKQIETIERKVNDLGAKSEIAQRRGQSDRAEQLLKEQKDYQESLKRLKESLQEVTETVEQVKERIRRDEDRFR
jgi:methyl-accepting chemotaxis protein